MQNIRKKKCVRLDKVPTVFIYKQSEVEINNRKRYWEIYASDNFRFKQRILAFEKMFVKCCIIMNK